MYQSLPIHYGLELILVSTGGRSTFIIYKVPGIATVDMMVIRHQDICLSYWSLSKASIKKQRAGSATTLFRLNVVIYVDEGSNLYYAF